MQWNNNYVYRYKYDTRVFYHYLDSERLSRHLDYWLLTFHFSQFKTVVDWEH